MARKPNVVKEVCDGIVKLEHIDDVRRVMNWARDRFKYLQHLAVLNLRDGMRVSFSSKRGVKTYGIIKGLTPNHIRNVPVITDAGVKWKVSANLLTIEEDGEGAKPTTIKKRTKKASKS